MDEAERIISQFRADLIEYKGDMSTNELADKCEVNFNTMKAFLLKNKSGMYTKTLLKIMLATNIELDLPKKRGSNT